MKTVLCFIGLVTCMLGVPAIVLIEAWYYERHPEKTPPDVSPYP